MLKNLLLLLVTFFTAASGTFPARAANYYVTQSGAGSRDGAKTGNAFSVSDFNGSDKPTGGDTISFSGTISSSITPKSNGTRDAQLVLDFTGATLNAPINISSRSYLTVSGGTTAASFKDTAINATGSTDVIIKDLTSNYSDANGWPTFISINGNTNTTISNCKTVNCGYGVLGTNDVGILITGCDFLSSLNGTSNVGNQTDLLHLGGDQNVVIEKSKLNLRAPGSSKAGSDGSARHNDVIQTFATGGSYGKSPSNWTIRYNWIENSNTTGDGNSSWLMIESQGGYFKMYDNVFVCPSNTSGINNGIHIGTGQNISNQYPFYNNTIVKKAYSPLNAISFRDGSLAAGTGKGTLFCVNNIAYCGLTGKDQGSTSNNFKVGKISNNFWFNFGNYSGTVPTIPPGNGGSSTVDPKFTDLNNNDFSLSSTSPCKGAGDNSLGSEYNQGIAPGSSWPSPTLVTRSGAWDAGAFVSNAGPAPSPTPTPSPTPPPYPTPTPAAKFSVGDSVAPTQEVKIRDNPAGNLLGTHNVDDTGLVKGGPTVADFNGIPVNWYEVTWLSDPIDGWVGDDNLVLSTAPTPTPTPTPAPTPTPTPTPTATPSPSASPTPPSSVTYEKWIEDQNNWIRAHPPTPDQKP